MKIAMSSQNLKSITGHAGMCRNFLLFEVEGREVTPLQPLQLTREQTFHELQDGAPHPLDGVQVLISGSMGQGLLSKLIGRRIQPIITPETDPQQAMTALLDGSLKIEIDLICNEHEHDHDHAHGHDDEDGHHAQAGHACGCNCGGR